MAGGNSMANIVKVKLFNCQECKGVFERKSNRQLRCKDCSKSVEKKRSSSDEGRMRSKAASKKWAEKNKLRTSEYNRRYFSENKEELTKKKKEWRSKNRDKVIALKREWRKNNADKVNDGLKRHYGIEENRVKRSKRSVEYRKERENEDLSFRFAIRARTRIKSAFRNMSTRKDTKSFDLLGMSGAEFASHIMNHPNRHESFTLENYGVAWVVDHIRPIASFDLSNVEHQKEAFHWSNCSPMGKKENTQKGNYWNGFWWSKGVPYSCKYQMLRSKKARNTHEPEKQHC